MTLRNQHVLDEKMLLAFRVSPTDVLCVLSLFVKWMSSYLTGVNTDACLCIQFSASVCSVQSVWQFTSAVAPITVNLMSLIQLTAAA